MNNIKVHVLSGNSEIAAHAQNAFHPADVVIYSGYSDSLDRALNYLSKNDLDSKQMCLNNEGAEILFIEDCSFEQEELYKFLEAFPNSSQVTKTIIYTESLEYKYLYKLSLYNVNAILHRLETPLPQAFTNLIETIKLMHKQKMVLDKIVADVLKRYSWCKS